MNRFYIYFHINPVTNEVFYVGLGSRKRAYDNKRRSKWWKSVVNKYGDPIIKIEIDNLTWEDAKEWEMLFIKHYGRRDLRLGTLVNMTDGGDGALGYKHTPEFIDKMKNIERNEKWRNGIAQSLKGQKHSIERRLKNKTSQIGKQSGGKNPRAIYYKFCAPWGGTFEICGCLQAFMREHKLGTMFARKLCSGKILDYKGWRLLDKVSKHCAL